MLLSVYEKVRNNISLHQDGLLMLFLSVLIGILAAYIAWLFRLLIGFVHNLAFYGRFDWHYDATQHAEPSVWGMGVILVPVIGGIIVIWITRHFSPEVRGSGIPQVISAIYYRAGFIRGSVSFFKAIASAITIGTGGSLGREGPIVQICAAFSSALGRLFKLSSSQIILLLACGASAGIAATFNAPLAGTMFAIELLMVSINSQTILAVAVSTVIAASIGQILMGPDPAFVLANLDAFSELQQNPWLLLIFFPFAMLMALFSIVFIRSVFWFEDTFNRLSSNEYFRHILGTLLLGCLFYGLFRLSGRYYVEGVGYATISSILTQALTDPWFLLCLFFAKLIATALTVGTGGSGGVFSPLLFLGASMGGAIGHGLALLFPSWGIDPITFAIVGMAAMVSASTSAPLTATLITYEMTRDYHSILPIMVCVSVSYAFRRMLMSSDMYTMNLLRRGEVIPQGLVIDLQNSYKAADVLNKNFRVIQWEEGFSPSDQLTLVAEEGAIKGFVRPFPYAVDFQIPLENIMNQDFVVARPESTLRSMLQDVKQQNAEFILVSYTGTAELSQVVGVLTAHDLAKAMDYARALPKT